MVLTMQTHTLQLVQPATPGGGRVLSAKMQYNFFEVTEHQLLASENFIFEPGWRVIAPTPLRAIGTNTHTAPNIFIQKQSDYGVIFRPPRFLPGLIMGGGGSFTRVQSGCASMTCTSSLISRCSFRLDILEYTVSTLGGTESSPSAASGN
jgi:hypothetical protein